MPKYLIERKIAGAGQMSEADLQGIAKKSCDVLRQLGPNIQWVKSFVSDDAVHCIYIAPNEDLVRKHANEAGFLVDRIFTVGTVMDPTTAEAAAA